jgi:hypothetical protein
MVVLSSRFTLLSGILCLAVISLPSASDAVAIHVQQAGFSLHARSNSSAESAKKPHHTTPISLPPKALKIAGGKGKGKKTKKSHKKGKKHHWHKVRRKPALHLRRDAH